MSTATQANPIENARRVEELGKIIMAYSEVTERLQQSHDQLNETVKRLQRELSDKNRELERRNRLAALGEMAAGMAHEIRNPLAGIQLYATMLRDDLNDRPESQVVVEKIRAGVRRMESLVSQVLHFTREITANPSPCEIVQIIRDSAELAAARAGEAPVQIELDLPECFETYVDAMLFGQAVLNLLCNAVEAMTDGGVVKVCLSAIAESDRSFALSITDTGPGIAPELLDRIFNPFFTTKDNGTGLGLAIVHRIVEAHNGTIKAGNAPGGGARFEILI